MSSEGRKSTRLASKTEKKEVVVVSKEEREDGSVTVVGPKKPKNNTAPSYLEGEEAETDKLEIIDEDPLDYTSNDNILPVRTLEDFYFYDASNNFKLCSLDEVGWEDRDVCAVGKVKASSSEDSGDYDEADEDEDEDSEEEKTVQEKAEGTDSLFQVVRLSSIFYWEIKHTPCGSSIIWVRTTYAWYKLLYPHPDYSRLFIPIVKRTRLANLVINSMSQNPNITYDEFLRELPSLSEQCATFPNSPPIRIKTTDLLRYIPYIKDEVQTHVELNDAFELFSVPLFDKLIGTPEDEFDLPTREAPVRRTVRKAGTTKEDKTTPPVFTPNISKLASGFIAYDSALGGAEKTTDQEALEEAQAKTEKLQEELLRNLNYGRPSKVTPSWVGGCVSSLQSKKIYDSATFDDEAFKTGDFIIINDAVSRKNRVIRVCLLFEDKDGSKKVLGRAFIPGRETLMEELATYNELFLTDIIQVYPVSQFIATTQVTHATAQQDESMFAGKFFFRYFYEIETGGYIDARRAISKGWTRRLYPAPLESPVVSQDQIKARSFEYRLYDFVYVLPSIKDTPYEIAQILPPELDDSENHSQSPWYTKASGGDVLVRLQYYKRHEQPVDPIALGTKYGPKKHIPDPRHVYRTNRFGMVDVNRLEGVCHVLHKETIPDFDSFRAQNDCFYVTDREPSGDEVNGNLGKKLIPLPKDEHIICESRENERLESLHSLQKHKETCPPLVALDIFSGCGGLSLGMERSGVVHTKYSVEFNCGAATTFKKNFPDATVYNQCANMLLKRAIKHHESQPLPAAKDFMGNPLPDMPKPGQVDLIYCGPPCQGFSGINRFKKANDIKNSLIATTLSYVDFYRPKYFMLENVRGLLNFRLGGTQAGVNRVEGGIKMGYVKFIMRCLTYMGYQTRISIQQAGNFGLAQSRRRVIIWGTHLGLRLPDYPQPTHCFGLSGSVNLPLPHGGGYISSKRTNYCAPHPAVTIYDAIADLEGFEYRNPCQVYAEDPALKDGTIERFPRLPVSGRPFVGKMKADYVQPPFSEFQRQIRQGAKLCYNHVTRPFNDLTIERICRVNMAPGSDHSSLPEKLKPWCLSHKDSAASRHNGWKGLFGRLDFKGHFLTALTDIQPMGKQGTVIHPSQRRVLTVRECARAQGFSDDFIFSSYNPDDTKDMHRQVGNAVPPPLGRALADQLVLALAENQISLDQVGSTPEMDISLALHEAIDTRLASLTIGDSTASSGIKRARNPNTVDQKLITDPLFAKNLRPRNKSMSLVELSDSDSDDFVAPVPTNSTSGKFGGIKLVAVEVPIPQKRYLSNSSSDHSGVAMED